MNRFAVLIMILIVSACSSGVMKQQSEATDQKIIINSNLTGTGTDISIEFFKGKAFNYPLMAVWIEDQSGNYIQTLYVPKSIATGVFKYGKQEKNVWVPSAKRAPQTLPYWAHKRAVKASDGLYMPDEVNPVADAYSGATPTQSFVLNTRSDNKLPDVFRLMFEINQNWDWNSYWTNDKYPDDENYKLSCQPALVYEAVIDQPRNSKAFKMKAVGHSHYSGKTGELFPDLSTLTTALEIADSIIVRVK